MLQDFKAFILRGNVVDLAVGVIVGGAFGKIVSSLVADIVMPPIGLLLGGVDVSNLFINLSKGSYETLAAAQKAGAATLNYGSFLKAVLDFLIIAAVIFLAIRGLARLQKPSATTSAPATRECPRCLSSVPVKATRCAHCTSDLSPA